jgi:hypothetical protein
MNVNKMMEGSKKAMKTYLKSSKDEQTSKTAFQSRCQVTSRGKINQRDAKKDAQHSTQHTMGILHEVDELELGKWHLTSKPEKAGMSISSFK